MVDDRDVRDLDIYREDALCLQIGPLPSHTRAASLHDRYQFHPGDRGQYLVPEQLDSVRITLDKPPQFLGDGGQFPIWVSICH
jgi:hypothetical protein